MEMEVTKSVKQESRHFSDERFKKMQPPVDKKQNKRYTISRLTIGVRNEP